MADPGARARGPNGPATVGPIVERRPARRRCAPGVSGPCNPGLSQGASEGGKLVATILVGHEGRRGLVHRLSMAEGVRPRGRGVGW